MLQIELPKWLQDEFERSARLIYDKDGITRALAEAIELWLAQHRAGLIESERGPNDQAYSQLRAQLEREHAGKWAVIAQGKLQGIGDSLDQVAGLSPNALDRLVFQIGATRPTEVELGWQMTFVA